MMVVLGQSACCRVVEATYLGMVLILSAKGPVWDGQASAKAW